MSTLETALAGAWWALPSLAAVAALLVSMLAYRRGTPQRVAVERLRRQLDVYAEASTRVADTLDQLLRGEVDTSYRHTASRRYVLGEAKRRLQEGEPLESLGRSLELSQDEMRLLGMLSGR